MRTKHLDTGEEVRNGLELLGMVDLTQEGLDRNVGKAHMKKVGSAFEKENNYKRKWQPHKGSRINIRQHHSAVASVKHLRVIPDGSVGSTSLVVNEPGTTGLQWFRPLLISSLAFNFLTVVFGLTAFYCLYSDVVCYPSLKRRRHAKQKLHLITKFSEKAHASEKCRTLAGSFNVQPYAVHQMLQSGGSWSCKDN